MKYDVTVERTPDEELLYQRRLSYGLESLKHAREHRYQVICEQETARLFFREDMTPDERIAMSCSLVESGLATFVVRDIWRIL